MGELVCIVVKCKYGVRIMTKRSRIEIDLEEKIEANIIKLNDPTEPDKIRIAETITQHASTYLRILGKPYIPVKYRSQDGN